MDYGYTRVSTKEQHLERGIGSIKQYAEQHNISLKKIFTDKQSGRNLNRPEYKKLRQVLKRGDRVIIPELDRLGRDRNQILEELRYLKSRNIQVMILELPTTLMDLSNLNDMLAKLVLETTNNMLIEMYALMSEAEMKKRQKRQREGIEQKKLRGEWEDYGRPRCLEIEKFRKIYEEGIQENLSKKEIMEKCHICRSTYYRYLQELRKQEEFIKCKPIL